jgi:hypothetical protein
MKTAITPMTRTRHALEFTWKTPIRHGLPASDRLTY